MQATTLDHNHQEASQDLGCIDLELASMDPRWALGISASFAKRKQVLPMSKVAATVTVACSNPQDEYLRKSVEKQLQHPCTLIAADAEALQRAITRVYDFMVLDENSPTATGAGSRDERDSAVAICDELVQAAVLRGASDIHLIPMEQGLSVRLRVDGVLENYREIAKPLQPIVISRFKVMAGMDIAEKRAPQDGRITAHSQGSQKKLEIRVASMPTRYGERLTLRLLASNAMCLSLPSIGMRDQDLQCFQTATARPHGLILLTGPTGSGKSTTLYLAIEHLLAHQGGNVITIEDPIEYEIAGASQVEVDPADKVNFSKALRSVLRHDPDVVMIGEIRDQETADIAIKAALTGHLVFSTLHTNTAAGVITRLIDMGVEPYLLAATLQLSVAQRLVRRLCPKCRVPHDMTPREGLLLNSPELEGRKVYEAAGCLHCAGKGFLGRIGLFEVLQNSSVLARLIASSASEFDVASEAQRAGGSTLLADGIAKVLQGETTIGELTHAVSLG